MHTSWSKHDFRVCTKYRAS